MPSLMPNGKQQFFDASGKPLVNGKVFTYAAGTNNPKPTFRDAAGVTANTNPIVLDARGEALVFWDGAYKIVLNDAQGNSVYTVDNYNTDPLGIQRLFVSGGADLVGFIHDDPSTGAVASNIASALRVKVFATRFMTQEQIDNIRSGTATIDITTALQKGIDYCMKQYDPTKTTHDGNNVTYMGRQKTLVLPAGIYRTTQTLDVSFRNHVEICGEGQWNTIIRWDGADNGMMMDVRCSNYVTMRNFTMDGAHKAKTFIYHAGNGKNAAGSKGNVTGNLYSHIYFWNQIGNLVPPYTDYPDTWDPLWAQLCLTTTEGQPYADSMDDSIIEGCRFAANSLNNGYGIAISSSAISVSRCYFFGANGILLSNGATLWMNRCMGSLYGPQAQDDSHNHSFIKFNYSAGGGAVFTDVELDTCYMESMEYYGPGTTAKVAYFAQGAAAADPKDLAHIDSLIIRGGLYASAPNATNQLMIDIQANRRANIKLLNAAYQGISKGYIYAPNSNVEIIGSSAATSANDVNTHAWQPISYQTLRVEYSTPEYRVAGERAADVTVTVGATDAPARLKFLSIDEAFPFISNHKGQVTLYMEKNDNITKNITLNSDIYLAMQGYTLGVNATVKNFGQLTILNSFANGNRGGVVNGTARGLTNYGAMALKNVAISNLLTMNGGRALLDNIDFQGVADMTGIGDGGDIIINGDNASYSGTGYVINLGSKFGRGIIKSSFGATPAGGKWMKGTECEFTSPSTGFANKYWATADGTGAGASWAKIGNLS